MSKLRNIYALGEISPKLPKNGDCWIAPDARIIGNVTLDEGVSIWWGAILRGDNDAIHIGGGSNLQEHCVGHVDPGFPLVIGKECTIGHRAIVHGCEIGDGSLIGMGAIVLNGAKVGRQCLIGAGALVTEGMVIPDKHLVLGMPARIKRPLSEEEIKALRTSAQAYCANKDRFKTRLIPL